MILICENCRTRYLVASSAIGPEGRTVRCTKCNHEWFQDYKAIDADFAEKPEEEEAPAEEERDAREEQEPEPIPDAVKPVPEGSGLPSLAIESEATGRRRGGLAGYMAAFLLFAGIAGLLVAFRATVIDVWPPAAGLYSMINMAPVLPGEGLVLDKITAVAEVNEQGVNTLEIEGLIVNTNDTPQVVPSLLSALRTADGKIYDVWEVKPPLEKIGPGDKVKFRTAYPEVPGEVKDVSIRFMLPK